MKSANYAEMLLKGQSGKDVTKQIIEDVESICSARVIMTRVRNSVLKSGDPRAFHPSHKKTIAKMKKASANASPEAKKKFSRFEKGNLKYRYDAKRKYKKNLKFFEDKDLDSLLSLPGIGRKTANVVLGNAFDIPGITVDTHFGRLARRFGWTSQKNPDKVEQDVAALFPAKDYTMLSHYVVWHGRRICHARKPACGACPVASLCPSFGEGPTDAGEAEALVRTQGRA